MFLMSCDRLPVVLTCPLVGCFVNRGSLKQNHRSKLMRYLSIVFATIPDVTHFKIIGSSGFGKSCLAAALLEQLLAQLTILALRGRKYRIFLLCCSQTDYSTDGLRVAQKQFRFRAAGGIDLTAARAAGFMSTELIKENFKNGQPGQGLFVV